MIINFIVFIFVIFLLFCLSMIWPPDSPWAPWWRTNKKTAIAICKLANINKNDIIYDLGCGDGEVLIQSAKLGATGIGIEIDPTRVFIAKLRVKRNKLKNKIVIKKNDFFKEDISKATVVIVYLVPNALKRLLPKFKKELKKGTKVVSFIYEIEGLKPIKIDSKNRLKIYII